jgi:hypothetical protein
LVLACGVPRGQEEIDVALDGENQVNRPSLALPADRRLSRGYRRIPARSVCDNSTVCSEIVIAPL